MFDKIHPASILNTIEKKIDWGIINFIILIIILFIEVLKYIKTPPHVVFLSDL